MKPTTDQPRIHVDPAPARAASRRSCEAARRFGLLLDTPTKRADAVRIHADLPTRGTILFTGPSGAGKSRLLARLRQEFRDRDIPCIDPAALNLRAAPAVDHFPDRSVDEAMSILASAGLAEARCFVRRPAELSEGQRWRLRLAVAMDRGRAAAKRAGRAAITIDGYADPLDDATARSAAIAIARFADRNPNITLALTTTRQWLARWLQPTSHLHAHLDGRIEHRPTTPAPPASSLYEITTGDLDDYRALAHTHYRAGDPASAARILKAVERATGDLVGALVVSMPTLNGAWRELAWPGRYETGDRKADAARLNDELRRISRVVICPRHRGVGLASTLVRTYLAAPLTNNTEAVAAMGRVSAFFQAAGMTPYRLAPTRRDARLLDALQHAGVENWRLATPRAALDRALRNAGKPFIERELRRWARDSRASRSLAELELEALFRRACRRVSLHPAAYAHTASTHREKHQ